MDPVAKLAKLKLGDVGTRRQLAAARRRHGEIHVRPCRTSHASVEIHRISGGLRLARARGAKQFERRQLGKQKPRISNERLDTK